MTALARLAPLVATLSCLAACSTGDGGTGGADAAPPLCANSGPGALSTKLTAKLPESHYVDQANRYFDAIDITAPAESVPTYAELVIRWEWPPWLKLTGFGREQMADTDKLVKKKAPAKVSPRDCRFFAEQPFARCRVSFGYQDMGGGKPCAIYEEFTFNDAGEITFIEAWSDLPDLLPTSDPADPWAEGPNVHRMSTKIPGLGAPDGRIDLQGTCMAEAAAADPEVADLVTRTGDFWKWWFAESADAGADYFARGCGW
ncbi:MAG: hypothetical protein U0359_21170 [Byssovorax sp.]